MLIMGKVRARKASRVIAAANDPTPERMAQAAADYRAAGGTNGDGSTLVDVVDVDQRTGQRAINKPRRLLTTRVDYLYNLGALSFWQWQAANWWRERVEDGIGSPSVCSKYDPMFGGGNTDPSPIPLTAKAEKARTELNAAKAILSLAERAEVEDALDDPHPPLTGAASTARCNRWRHGLNALASYLRYPA
jgi:hypothetical protein